VSGRFYFSEDHNSVEAVPKRQARFHLNSLKFLESYCTDCLQITQIKNNGDGTIDLTVRIDHPFNGFPQYTGFDVKGIIMFNGSYEYPFDSINFPWPNGIIYGWPKQDCPDIYSDCYKFWDNLIPCLLEENGNKRYLSLTFHYVNDQCTQVKYTLIDFTVNDPDLD